MILLITHNHKDFGGWFRVNCISEALQRRFIYTEFVYNPRYFKNPFIRILIGLRNSWYVIHRKFIYILDPLMPETLLPALTAKLLRKNVVIDISDEWLESTTGWVRKYVAFIEPRLARWFPLIIVPCEYLYEKFSKMTDSTLIKLTNGVNPTEFKLIPKGEARKKLNFRPDDKIMLAIGNTFGGERRALLWKVYNEVKALDPKVILIAGTYIPKEDLPYYLGACDLALFPTNGAKNELACCSIRVMTYINAEKVIATDDSPSEWHTILENFDCGLMGKDLAKKIIRFFNDKKLRKRLEKNVKRAKNALQWDNLIEVFIDNCTGT